MLAGPNLNRQNESRVPKPRLKLVYRNSMLPTGLTSGELSAQKSEQDDILVMNCKKKALISVTKDIDISAGSIKAMNHGMCREGFCRHVTKLFHDFRQIVTEPYSLASGLALEFVSN
jgi:hypothetical protein